MDIVKSVSIIFILAVVCGCSEPNSVTPDVVVYTTASRYQTTDTVRVVLSNGLEDTVSFFHCIGYFSSDVQWWDGQKWVYIATYPFCLDDLGDTPPPRLEPHGSVQLDFRELTWKSGPAFKTGLLRLVYSYWSDHHPRRSIYSNAFSIVE